MKRSIGIKRIVSLLTALALLFLCGCDKNKTEPGNNADVGIAEQQVLLQGEHKLSAAVVYDSKLSNGSWQDTFGYLTQSLVLGVTAQAIDASGEFSLEGFDILFLDSSLAQSANAEIIREAVVELTLAGCTAILANELYELFDKDFIGAWYYQKLEEYPLGTIAIDNGSDFEYIENIIQDFSYLYRNYPDFAQLKDRDYGYMAACNTAKPLIGYGAYALYSANDYGEGCVIFTNPLLPNGFSAAGFTMEAYSDEQTAFASTTASCSQLLVNAFAEYAYMRRYGYSMSRVFGSFGGDNMAWELHYEEITAFENGSAQIFGELCRENNQIPSYTLIRSTYKWFLRQESITCLLNEAEDGIAFNMDYNESAYSSGTHIAADGKWLGLSSVENGGSYFSDYTEYDFRAAPAAADTDGDGLIDIISGSEDGKFYFFRGAGYSDRLHTLGKTELTDADGAAIAVPGYSSPVIIDADGDGIQDIISGSSDGRIYWFKGDGAFYTPMGCLYDTGELNQAIPAAGDIDGDGETELIVCVGGKIYCAESLFGGSLVNTAARIENFSLLGYWLSPTVCDYNNDGITDLAFGSFDGYIALREGRGDGSYADAGYITCSEKNYKGNNNIKFGNYSMPVFADINGDGRTDLICGCLEYGMAVPIDSEYFPFSERLKEQLEYMRENGFYCGVHFYTNKYASEERESYELQRQLISREYYGLSSDKVGANQHTWHTSSISTAQTFISLWKNGILWNSGFITAGAASIYPHMNAQNAVSLPFFLEYEGEKTILIQNNSTVLYTDEGYTDISARYGMPICMYYHCDFAWKSDAEARSMIEKAEKFREKHDYNFVGEDQLMKASAAAYNLTVEASAEGNTLTLIPGEASCGGALYDKAYQKSCGIRLRFAEGTDRTKISIDSSVAREKDGALYIAADKPVTIAFSSDGDLSRITSVNLPADISINEGGAELCFLEGGMMQVKVKGNAKTDSEGWESKTENGITCFTKFGKADTIVLKY